MIAIKYGSLFASWSSKSEVWESDDKEFAEFMNELLPDEDDISVSTYFKIGGMDKLVLDSAKKVLGKKLKVIAFHPTPAPEEIAGVVY